MTYCITESRAEYSLPLVYAVSFSVLKTQFHFQWNISLYVPSAVLFHPASLCLFFMIPPAPRPSQPIVRPLAFIFSLRRKLNIDYECWVPSVQRTDNCFPAQRKDEAIYPTWQESVFIFREENEDEQANRPTRTSLLSRPVKFFSIKKTSKKNPSWSSKDIGIL